MLVRRQLGQLELARVFAALRRLPGVRLRAFRARRASEPRRLVAPSVELLVLVAVQHRGHPREPLGHIAPAVGVVLALRPRAALLDVRLDLQLPLAVREPVHRRVVQLLPALGPVATMRCGVVRKETTAFF